mmetsp:Transcript_5433/g.22972  ORF Transcript_5433/g.22972 Transcript_5433/m.22972 type:complete len:318 (-) Transcript_5433:909-1862(-)
MPPTIGDPARPRLRGLDDDDVPGRVPLDLRRIGAAKPPSASMDASSNSAAASRTEASCRDGRRAPRGGVPALPCADPPLARGPLSDSAPAAPELDPRTRRPMPVRLRSASAASRLSASISPAGTADPALTGTSAPEPAATRSSPLSITARSAAGVAAAITAAASAASSASVASRPSARAARAAASSTAPPGLWRGAGPPPALPASARVCPHLSTSCPRCLARSPAAPRPLVDVAPMVDDSRSRGPCVPDRPLAPGSMPDAAARLIAGSSDAEPVAAAAPLFRRPRGRALSRAASHCAPELTSAAGASRCGSAYTCAD